MLELYTRIPFYASCCIYRGFYSTVPTKKKDERLFIGECYVNVIRREMELHAEKNSDNSGERVGGLSTIYLGDGTPSRPSFESPQEMFQTVDKVYHTGLEWGIVSSTYTTTTPIEVTMEYNPDDVTGEFAQGLRSLPTNRISTGAQTFPDGRLRLLHHRHTADEVETIVKCLRSANIRNMLIDLMFGLPDKTLEEWKEDVERLLALGIEHISAYSLVYKGGTPLCHLLQIGKVKDMNDELYRQIYDTLIDRLAEAGYEQYEANSFAELKLQSSNLRVQISKFSVRYLSSKV